MGFNDKGLQIMSFPTNDFWRHTPGDNAAIKEFMRTKYKVKYIVFEKCSVNGPDASPVWNYMRANCEEPGKKIESSWASFLLDEEGKVLKWNSPFSDSPKSCEEQIRL